ncbi:hypothetical protein V2A60_000283 [Cordyceps javanica]|uniref:Zinc finger protein n=1 Tax=Cordyceps javanica TaxID=43265 RepID=A0A545W2Z2_9HYPO|nr:zinc finger protein [Cordyceps javanica]TQW08320.1 zinc finger protein [Cordyceps javanica]
MDATGHDAPDFECDTFDRYFGSQYAVNQHMTDLGHWAESSDSESDMPEYECDDCTANLIIRRTFATTRSRSISTATLAIAIPKHLRSKIHRTSSVRCFFCKAELGTATGLVHHLESGCCPRAPLSRDTLYEAVRRRDPDGVISKKLLTWTGSASYKATEKTWSSAFRRLPMLPVRTHLW